MSDTENSKEQQQHTLKMILISSGIAMAFLGSICLMMPEQTASFTNLALQETKYLGYALLFIGIVEALIIPRTLFRNNERK